MTVSFGGRAAVTALIMAVGLAAADRVEAQEDAGFLATSLRYSERMLDRQEDVTNKVAIALRARQSGQLGVNRITFGGRFLGTVIYENTNTPGKFPILSRLPPTHTSGTTDTYGVINDISLIATATTPLLTAVVQGEYTEVEYPGQNDIQLRKAWLAVGDLDRSPFYLAVGRKTVNFGNFASYAPFTHTHNSHYFWAQTKDPLIEIGYITERTELALSIIRNHRGNRVISSPKNDDHYTNYALNASHRIPLANGMGLKLGAGFLRGTIYDSTIAHHPPGSGIDRGWNGAWDIHATLSAERFDVMAEFTQTTDRWPATDHKVSALTLQGRYRGEVLGRPAVYSLSASHGRQGASGTEWESMSQIILGMEVALAPNVTLGAEYLFNDGFVPLILPRRTGDASVRSHSVILGAKLTF
ncbi:MULTISPECIES: hypothetical protein [unclassified Phaeobacter]|uniref:hypothetical protein n=1 Tax=unclassified Phaeobacter TaxID=2621772 RepID=UPI003A870CD4